MYDLSQKKLGTPDPENWSLPVVLWREVDSLVCPKCQGEMIIIAFMEHPHIIKKILKHLNMWEIRNHGPLPVNTETITQIVYDDTYSQIPPYEYWTELAQKHQSRNTLALHPKSAFSTCFLVNDPF